MPYLMMKVNDTLTNDIVSFEQMGPGVQSTITPSYTICVSGSRDT